MSAQVKCDRCKLVVPVEESIGWVELAQDETTVVDVESGNVTRVTSWQGEDLCVACRDALRDWLTGKEPRNPAHQIPARQDG